MEVLIFLTRRPRAAAALQIRLPSWRNWQTRMVQVHVPATVWGFESLRWHQESFLSPLLGLIHFWLRQTHGLRGLHCCAASRLGSIYDQRPHILWLRPGFALAMQPRRPSLDSVVPAVGGVLR